MPLKSTGRSPWSKTAEAAAVGRAIEHRRRAEDRIVDDPFAEHLVRPAWRAMINVLARPVVGAAMLAINERRLPGVLGNLLCRTRYIDDRLSEAVADGFEQIACLGSGLDSRAYRIAGIRRAQVFEVDRRDMLVWKQQRMRPVLASPAEHVLGVACDFINDDLDQVVRQSPFQPNLRTFFICEGVTQYLSPEAVDAVLRFVASAAPGSRVAFTYIDRHVVDSPDRRSVEDRRVVSFASRAGEPWRFGFAPPELPRYLEARGLQLLEQVGAMEYRERILEPLGRTMRLYEKEFAVLAEVV